MRDNVLKKLEQFVSRVPDNKYSKTIAAISLFDFMDIIRADDYPIDWLDRLTGSLKNIQDGLLAQEQTILFGDFEFSYNDDTYEDIAQQTGEVYFKLWRRFDSIEYFDKTTESLNTRFKLNGVDQFQNKSVLDAGCGSGRYSQALQTLGSATVTGLISVQTLSNLQSVIIDIQILSNMRLGLCWTCHSMMIALISDLVMGCCIIRRYSEGLI